jgi:hypothetical protein
MPGPDELHAFFVTFADAVANGEPINSHLYAASLTNLSPEIKEVIKGLMSDLEAGIVLSNAMERRGGCFNPTCIAMVRSGEATGELYVAMKKIVDLRMAYLGDTGDQSGMDTVRYVNILLCHIMDNVQAPVTIRRSEVLPVLPARYNMGQIQTTFGHVINRLKVMSGLNPVAYPKAVDRVFSVGLQGRAAKVAVSFDDSIEDPYCTIHILKEYK